MAVPCIECVTRDFCINIGRCIDFVLEDHYGEAKMQDEENMTAEEVDLEMPNFEEDVLNRRLTNRERTIIEKAIKGF